MLEDSAWITLHFRSPGFQNWTRRLTQTNTTALQTPSDLSSARNILFARITSNEPVCFEGWNKSDPPENQIWHTAVASLASYQSTLISGRSFFSQWYFPSSEQSTNEILWEIVASSPFLCPSRLGRSLAHFCETRFTRPNRRACSHSMLPQESEKENKGNLHSAHQLYSVELRIWT